MARTAVSELQQQIEEVRREAFAAGYAAAMQAIRELASRPATDARPATTRRGRRGGGGRKPGVTTPSRRQRVGLRKALRLAAYRCSRRTVGAVRATRGARPALLRPALGAACTAAVALRLYGC